MLMVASRRQRKVRVLQITCCCWFSRQRPLHTHRREASAESLTPAISTGPTYSTSRPACVLCRIARPIGDSDEQDPKLCQTQPAFPSTFSRHWGRALLLRRCLAQVVRRYRLSRNFFCGKHFRQNSQQAQRAPITRSRCLFKRSSTRSDRPSYRISTRYFLHHEARLNCIY
jgi:hypothetical protein